MVRDLLINGSSPCLDPLPQQVALPQIDLAALKPELLAHLHQNDSVYAHVCATPAAPLQLASPPPASSASDSDADLSDSDAAVESVGKKKKQTKTKKAAKAKKQKPTATKKRAASSASAAASEDEDFSMSAGADPQADAEDGEQQQQEQQQGQAGGAAGGEEEEEDFDPEESERARKLRRKREKQVRRAFRPENFRIVRSARINAFAPKPKAHARKNLLSGTVLYGRIFENRFFGPFHRKRMHTRACGMCWFLLGICRSLSSLGRLLCFLIARSLSVFHCIPCSCPKSPMADGLAAGGPGDGRAATACGGQASSPTSACAAPRTCTRRTRTSSG